MGFTQPTPVQEKAIPLLLGNNPTDFIGLAQTGTGKTAAFGLPLVELIDSSNRSTQAIIMAPTRELGQQTAKQMVDFAKNIDGLNVVVVYGGAAIVNQIQQLKKPSQIVVATPGRLLDLIKRKAVKLENVKPSLVPPLVKTVDAQVINGEMIVTGEIVDAGGAENLVAGVEYKEDKGFVEDIYHNI